jgi:hypothetical protein
MFAFLSIWPMAALGSRTDYSLIRPVQPDRRRRRVPPAVADCDSVDPAKYRRVPRQMSADEGAHSGSCRPSRERTFATDRSGSRLCENTKSISQILILANFGQQTCSESNYMRVFYLVFRSNVGGYEFSHSLGRQRNFIE